MAKFTRLLLGSMLAGLVLAVGFAGTANADGQPRLRQHHHSWQHHRAHVVRAYRHEPNYRAYGPPWDYHDHWKHHAAYGWGSYYTYQPVYVVEPAYRVAWRPAYVTVPAYVPVYVAPAWPRAYYATRYGYVRPRHHHAHW